MRKLLLATVATLALSGCLYRQPVYQGNLMEKVAVDQLQAGMSKQQVMTLLGTPSINDPFHHDRWDYTSSQRIGRNGKTEVHDFTVYFTNDSVTRWEGSYFPEQDEELAKSANKLFGPNLRKDKDKDKDKHGSSGDQ